MRNPERIYTVMALITSIWEKYPNIRFNQLIGSLQSEYSNLKDEYKVELWNKHEYRGIVSYQRFEIADLFYVEDDEFIEFLRQKVKENW